MKLEDLPNVTILDALTLMCGEFIGSGISRQVYVNALNDAQVVKLELTRMEFQNVLEAQIWSSVREAKDIARWFAPVIGISDHGRWLIQARTKPVTIDKLRKELPKVPAFFTDLKVSNWGLLGRRIVCHDFGRSLITKNGLTMRMRKADWWE